MSPAERSALWLVLVIIVAIWAIAVSILLLGFWLAARKPRLDPSSRREISDDQP